MKPKCLFLSFFFCGSLFAMDDGSSSLYVQFFMERVKSGELPPFRVSLNVSPDDRWLVYALIHNSNLANRSMNLALFLNAMDAEWAENCNPNSPYCHFIEE